MGGGGGGGTTAPNGQIPSAPELRSSGAHVRKPAPYGRTYVGCFGTFKAFFRKVTFAFFGKTFIALQAQSAEMGLLFSKVFARLRGIKEVRILILGLDNAGKTTILCTHPFPSIAFASGPAHSRFCCPSSQANPKFLSESGCMQIGCKSPKSSPRFRVRPSLLHG